jgi:GntR family transcriptional regulator / MocR family aminotransferase
MDIPLNLNPKSSEPLYRQLYDSFRNGIIDGRFEAGSKLPASRALSKSIGVSRITVTECYERLISEGYLKARRGSGTFVCAHVPEGSLFASHEPETESKERIDNNLPPRLSRYGTAVNFSLHRLTPPDTLRLDRHGPDVSHFPRKVWGKLLARRLQESNGDLFNYAHDFRGEPKLRDSIARYLAKARAVICDPDQILIVSGSQQAIYLSARILLNEGDRVAMESPGYYFAGQIFSSQGAEIVPIPVDKHGIEVAKLNKQNDIRMVYVTPSHQFPTGASLTLSRRRALLSWAQKNNAFIIEDDYDSEFRYRERPLPALQGISPDSSVIYTGSFSKMLFPSVRLGYLVLPRKLFTAFRTAKLLNDLHSSTFHQHILGDFLAGGHLESHLRRMRTLYDKRRTLLIHILRNHFGSNVSIFGDEAGMYLLARFRINLSEEQAYDRALKIGVRLERLFWPGGIPVVERGYVRFVFAYAALSEKDLQQVGRRLATAFLS